MAPPRSSRSHHQQQQNRAGPFFIATLLLWAVSVLFEVTVNHRTQLLFVLYGFLFYQSANWIVRTSISRDPLLVNTCVSLLHSTITSASVIFTLINHWNENGLTGMFEHSQLVDITWAWAYPALCFSSGYFAYDQWDILHYRLYSGWIPSILIHHLILLICFTLALYRDVTINYLILTLICELHSIFLHVRKVRRMVGVRDVKSKFVKLEWVLNWITFFFARSTTHILITIKLIQDAPKFRNGVELPLALFGMTGMNLLNFFLGIDLFKAFVKEISSRTDEENHNS